MIPDMFLMHILYEDDLKPWAIDCDDVNQHSFTCWDGAMWLGTTEDPNPSFLSTAEKEKSKYYKKNIGGLLSPCKMKNAGFITDLAESNLPAVTVLYVWVIDIYIIVIYMYL